MTENSESTVSQRMTPTERIDSEEGTFDLADGTEGAEREDGSAGLPKKEDVPQETIDSIEADREERLDPDNRPENTEINNTDRQFDAEAGMFTDDPNYDGELKSADGDSDSDSDEDEVPVSDLEGPSAQESMINPDADNPTTPEN